MRHKTTFAIGMLLAAVFVIYMISYQVNFNETAVVTTFGKADASSVYVGHMEQPEAAAVWGNLHFKWPWPIQKVRKYDSRVQVLEDRLDEQQTLDKQSVIINAYVAWRISDPLQFFRSLVTEEQAEQQILSLMRDARSVIGNYTFDELTNQDESRIKLASVEQDILRKLQTDLDRHAAQEQPWGIEFVSVGIKRVILPESVTSKVFERMRATREALAQRATSEGDARARNIKSEANSWRDTILAFADRRAQEIRAEGDAAAAEYYEVFQQNEGFAMFLRKMEMLRQTLSNNTTFFFDTRNSVLFREFYEEPTPSTVEQYSDPLPSQAHREAAAEILASDTSETGEGAAGKGGGAASTSN